MTNDAAAAMYANEQASVEQDQQDYYVTEADIATVLAALRTAVAVFGSHADMADGVFADRIAEQFNRQAADCERIMGTLEQYPSVRITF